MNSKARAAIAEAKANLARMGQEETDDINENHDGSLFEDPVERWKHENREIKEQRCHVKAERKLREEIIALRQLDDLTTSQIIALRQQLDDLSCQLVEARQETARHQGAVAGGDGRDDEGAERATPR